MGKILHRNPPSAISRRSAAEARLKALCDELVRPALRAAFYLYRLVLLVRKPNTLSVHALVLTRRDRVVLVKLRYAGGWRLPGGGRSTKETPRQAVLRELREEIGLVKHGKVQLAYEVEDDSDGRSDRASMIIVEDVEYRTPRWSWEVEDIIEAPFHQLPQDLTRSAAWLLQVFLENRAGAGVRPGTPGPAITISADGSEPAAGTGQ